MTDPALRQNLERIVELLIEAIDQLDPDPDCEPDADDEDGGDSEPSLGSTNPTLGNGHDRGAWSAGSDDDREFDEADDPRGELDPADHPLGEGGPDGGIWGVLPA